MLPYIQRSGVFTTCFNGGFIDNVIKRLLVLFLLQVAICV